MGRPDERDGAKARLNWARRAAAKHRQAPPFRPWARWMWPCATTICSRRLLCGPLSTRWALYQSRGPRPGDRDIWVAGSLGARTEAYLLKVVCLLPPAAD